MEWRGGKEVAWIRRRESWSEARWNAVVNNTREDAERWLRVVAE
jgi:hypothetical protein